jgi:hypothetical protein
MEKSESEAREAKWGEKMIEVKIRFWTNDLTDKPDVIIPKHGWTSGVVRMEKNKSHGIVPGKPRMFHSLLDIGTAIERTLKDHDIVLRPSPTMEHYLSVKKD